jgi:uncharacterized membrane protein YqjE
MDDRLWRASEPDEPREPPASTTEGLRDQLGQLAGALASGLDTRIRLALLDLAQERERTRDRVVFACVVGLALFFTCLAVNALVIALLWDSLGWRSLVLTALVWVVVAGLATWRLSRLTRQAGPPFASTLAELEKDRRWIMERFRRNSR